MPKLLENAGLKVGMAFIHLKKTHTKSWAICNSSVMKNFHKGSCTFHVVDSLHAQIWEILTSRGKKESCLSVIINIYQVIFSFFIIFFSQIQSWQKTILCYHLSWGTAGNICFPQVSATCFISHSKIKPPKITKVKFHKISFRRGKLRSLSDGHVSYLNVCYAS